MKQYAASLLLASIASAQHYHDHSDYDGHHGDHHGYDANAYNADWYGLDYVDESYGNVPSGDFYGGVDAFNEWVEIWNQQQYEERLWNEAEIMISLEALREGLLALDYVIDDLEECISDNDSGIEHNDYLIADNDDGIDYNDEEIENQRYRVKRLQK